MKKNKKNWTIFIIRWIGRIITGLIILLMIAFIFGEGFPDFAKLTTKEIILFLAFLAILAGYIVAWWKEAFGIILIIAGTIFFWGVNSVVTGKLWMGWFIFVFPLSTIPYIYCWWKEK